MHSPMKMKPSKSTLPTKDATSFYKPFNFTMSVQHKDMNEVVAEYPSKKNADIIEFYYNWKFHEPDYSRWQCTKRQIDIVLVSGVAVSRSFLRITTATVTQYRLFRLNPLSFLSRYANT